MKVGEVYALLGMDFSQFNKDERVAKARVQSLGGGLSGILKNAFSFSLGLGLMQGFRSLGGAVTDFINTASRTEVLNVALKSVAKSSGYAIDAVNAHKDAVMDKGIAEQEATQILNRFMQAQLDTADAANLARVAQDAAVIAGYNSSQAAEQMTEAIAKQRPELLSAFGMTRNMNEIYNDYARTIGRTATQLTEAQKKQAMLNYILGEGEKIAGTYEASMGAVGKQISSLPRYWDTLKNAIAKPLALPAISVIVDALTNGLKNAIAWAEANKATLERWGQSIANTVKTVGGWISGFARTVAANWTLIRNLTLGVVWAFVSFKTASLYIGAVTKAQSMLALVTGILRGEQLKTTATTGMLSVFVSAYNKSLAAATAAGVAQIGVLQVLQAAIHGVNAALAPLLWPLMIIGAVLGVGVTMWSKYTQAVQAAAQKKLMDKMAQQQKDYIDSVNKAAQGTGDQADALGEMGKAANKNLQSFDEVHTLMEDVADATLGGPALDAGVAAPAIPEMELPDFTFDMDAAIAQAKADMGGFWGWLKQSAAEAWGNVKTWAGNVWDGVKEKWGNFKTWLAGWWNEHVAPWFTKEKWIGLYNNMLTSLQETWTSVATWWQNTALSRWWNEDVAPWFTKAKWLELYSTIGTSLQETWDNTVTWWQSTALAKWWNEHVAPWFTKGKWLELYDNVSTGLRETWDGAVAWWNSSALGKWWNEHVSPWFTREKWLELYMPIKTSIQGIWADIEEWWNNTLLSKAFNWGRNLVDSIVDGIKSIPGKLRDGLESVGNTIKEWLGFESPTKKGPGRYADKWAPNLMRMYAQGILANIDLVQDAASAAARSLGAMAATPAPAFGGARLAGVGAGGYAPSSMPQPEIHLHIGTLVADDYGLKKLERALRKFRLEEDQRIGDAQ